MEKAAEYFEIRKVKKNQYFIHEGEPTGFFAGVIKGKVSIRKTHIFDKNTNEIVIKPLYKIIMLKKANIIKNTRRNSSNFIFFKNFQENNNNNNIDNNNDNDNNNNNINKKESSKIITPMKNNSKSLHNKTFLRMNTSKTSLKNKEEKSNKDFRIIKEVFDPDKYIVTEEELFRQGEGYCFGEWALIYREPRSASIYTLEDCIFFILDEIHFKNSFLKSLNNSEYNKKKFALQNFLPFDMMTQRQLSIYKNIVPIICKRNQIVFNEGDLSDSIYLIYLGSFTLEKKYGNKQFRVLNLERGSIVGLESIFEGEDNKYKCSLTLSRGFDVGLIFKLKINKLKPYIIKKMKISFKTNYNVFLKSWNDLFCKNILIQQRITKDKMGGIKEEGINEFEDFLNKNNELIEFNGDLFNRNWNSVLNIEEEDKYEVLFKDCLKTKLYDNFRKDGSLRIFSSRQKNKIFEYNNKNMINNSNSENIINYFNNTWKFELGINHKTTNSFRNRKYDNLNINEGSQSIRNYKSLSKNNLNLTEIKKSNKFNEYYDEETINKNSFNNEELILKKQYKLKNIKNLLLNPKHTKINKKLLYENNKIKENNSNDYQRNKYITIHFKNENNKNNSIPKDFDIINKVNNQIENRNNNYHNIRIKNENINEINYNKNLIMNNNTNNIASKEYINDRYSLSKNNSFLQNNKNISIERKNIDNYLNIKSVKNKILYNNININMGKINQKKQLFKISLINRNDSRRKILYEKENHLFNKKHSSFEHNHLSSPLNNKTNNLFISFNKDNEKNINININKRNNIFNKRKMYNFIKKHNYSNRNKKLKNYIRYEDSKNLHQELNLNNGFSISYFKKINSSNNISNLELSNKNKNLSSDVNLFRVSFDSGLFKIPLISSSVRLKKL